MNCEIWLYLCKSVKSVFISRMGYGSTPTPVLHFRHVFAVRNHIFFVLCQLTLEECNCIIGLESGNSMDGVNGELKAVHIVEYDHIKRSGCSSLFFIATHMHVVMVPATVAQTVNQPGIAVVCKDHRLVRGKQRVKRLIGQTMRMLPGRLQRHQVYDVHHSDLYAGNMFPQQ